MAYYCMQDGTKLTHKVTVSRERHRTEKKTGLLPLRVSLLRLVVTERTKFCHARSARSWAAQHRSRCFAGRLQLSSMIAGRAERVHRLLFASSPPNRVLMACRRHGMFAAIHAAINAVQYRTCLLSLLLLLLLGLHSLHGCDKLHVLGP